MTQQWKPISSAPKDGSEFLACYARQGNVKQIVKWNTLHGYFSSKGEPLPGFTTNATHWQPLPAAPCQTCNGHGMVGGLTPQSGYDSEPCPDCRTPPASAQDDAKDERQAFEAWAHSEWGTHAPSLLHRDAEGDYIRVNTEWTAWQAARASVAAPAAGDARDAARLDWLQQHDGRFFNKDRISSIVGVGFLVAGDPQGVRHPTVRAAIDAARAASQQQEG